jgi:hypothetical protein
MVANVAIIAARLRRQIFLSTILFVLPSVIGLKAGKFE